MHLSPLPWDYILILTALGVIVPWRGFTRMRKLFARPVVDTVERLSLYGSTIAFQWFFTGVTIWRVYAHMWSPATVGLALPKPVGTIALGATLAVTFCITQIAALRSLSRVPADRRGFIYDLARRLMPKTHVEVLLFLALVCTVSVCEEFLYRGFAYACFETLFAHSRLAAAIGSAALFAIGHIYQGRRGVTTTFLMGVIFAAIRAWSGSLVACVMAHFAVDLVAGLGPRFQQLQPSEAATADDA